MRLFLFCAWLACFLPIACILKGAHAAELPQWDKTDTALATALLVSSVIDWRQTQVIAANPSRFQESNPMLGSHPSMRRVNGYFIASIAAGAAVAYVLPPTYRKVFLGVMTARELHYDLQNHRLGIGFNLNL